MKRRVWLAILLTLCLPGLGHLYCGRVDKAIGYFVIMLVVANLTLAALLFADTEPLNIVVFLVVNLLYAILLISDIIRTARRAQAHVQPHIYNRWYVYLALLVVWVFAADDLLPVFGTYVGFRVPSATMENALLVGDYFLADMTVFDSQEPDRSDIAVYVSPVDGITKYVKRCVALPGDTVLISNKKLFINGEVIPGPSTLKFIDTTENGNQVFKPRRPDDADSRDNFGPYVILPDHYFMMGDNRDNSYDSRYYGPVHRDLLLGKALRIYWSKDWGRIGMKVK